jgi:hypothetical protein
MTSEEKAILDRVAERGGVPGIEEKIDHAALNSARMLADASPTHYPQHKETQYAESIPTEAPKNRKTRSDKDKPRAQRIVEAEEIVLRVTLPTAINLARFAQAFDSHAIAADIHEAIYSQLQKRIEALQRKA